MIRILAEHRVAANLAMIIMIMAGVWAVKSIPSQLDPPQVFPEVWIEVQWRGAAAEDIAELVTTPIEQRVRTIADLKGVKSRTQNGFATIRARFNYEADMMLALDTVKQRVSNVRNLPPDIEPLVVRRIVDLEPIARVLVTGDGTLDELVPLVRAMEKDLLRRGVASVFYEGMPQEEIALMIGSQRLVELSLTLDDLATEIARVSRNVPAGKVGRGQGARQLRSLEQKRDALSFEALQIQSGDTLIRLGNIAEIVKRPRDGEPRVTQNDQPAIAMILWRATAEDAYLAERVLNNWYADTVPTLPAGVTLTIMNNVWELLGGQLDMLVKNAVSGMILVVGTLFLFLHGRVGWWVTVGMPVSFMGALALFHGVFGQGISIIALIGFIMALGIVVDDAIVVGEDAATHFANGKSPLEAAVAGAQRMWVPVVTSSLTTLAAFIPLVLVGGEAGATIITLPTVLFCIIIASLIECFAILPGHLRASLGKMRTISPSSFRARFDAGFERFRDTRFKPLVERALDYPGATVCAAIGGVACAFALISAQHVGVNLATGWDLESVEANIEFSAAATDADKAAFLDHLEQALDATDLEHDDGVNILGWTTKENIAKFNGESEAGVQYASIDARYAYEESRTIPPKDFAAAWRSKIKRPPFIEQLYVGVNGGTNGGQPDITLLLRGGDLTSLKQAAEEVAEILAGYPGVSNVFDNLPYGREQLIFTLTPTGRSLGLTSDSVGRQLRAAYTGRRVQIFNDNESELEVRVVLPDRERDDLGQLQRFPIRTPAGQFVPLGNIASLYNRRSIDVIRHDDLDMAVAINADVDPDVANAINITNDFKDNALPAILTKYNLSFGLGGASERDQMILRIMTLGGVLTLILIYLILAWVFASYLWPLAIMTAIPFGLTGAILGHWLMGIEIGAMTMLAFFSLTGIVVNDSIVLISFFKRDVEAGRPLREALTDAVVSRFRAVILTSLTTIAGLSPLMFESSSLSMYVTPIAVTLCFGLALATGLVLLVIPALILLLETLKAHAAHQLSRVMPRFANATVRTGTNE
ncbi:MAG: efflux RND transporter permease subunit [Gammaproteobacteria bacterium]|nr:efflux RND transporter permease subunit [Gammaproteobacteria bacterium]